MNVFIPVYFNAPLGGLQSHVRAQCKAVIESGSSATVMCKPGVFSEILKADGVTVLTNDFKDVVDAADQALSAGSYDIVHAHPFESRIVGTIVSLRQNIPLFVTFHHMYFDHVSSWFQHSSLIITVTHSIRDLIVKEYDIEKSKIIIIPNTIRIESNANEQQIQDHQASQKKLIVTVSSRLDDDKIILVNNLVKALQECIEHNNYQIKWQICGDGKYFEKIKNLGDVLNNASGENIFEMPGWLEMNELQKYYRNADICIGPGRSALDAMTCGKPVIAVGNKGYIGLIRPENIMEGIYSNFGEYISLNSENHLLLYEELISCIQNRNELYDAGIRSSEFIRQYFNENKESSNLLSLYKYFSSNYRDSRLKKFKDITSADWVFSGKTKPVVMGKWHLTKDIEADITIQEAGILSVSMDKQDTFYICSGKGPFDMAGSEEASFQIDPDADFEFEIETEINSKDITFTTYVIGYGPGGRQNTVSCNNKTGRTVLFFRSSATAQSFRVLYRVSGKGNVRIWPFKLIQHCSEPISR